MRTTSYAVVTIVTAALGALPGTATAQSGAAAQAADAQTLRREIDQLRSDFETLRQEYGQRLSTLESRLTAIQGGQSPEPGAAPGGVTAQTPQAPASPSVQTAQVPPGAEGAGGPSGALPVYGGAAAGSKIFNPDIAVIGDFLGAAGHNAVAPLPALALHESEASFQAVVDPYARADFFISFGEEGVEVEEGTLTFTSLPGGLLTKVGKVRAAFGKVNTLHNHVLPWTDRPLVTENLVGGEEGISDAGISVARLIPNRFLFLEATGQVFRGDSGETLFHSSQRSDLSYVGHLRGYQDLSESTNLDLGWSYAHGHNPSGIVDGVDIGRFTTDLWGIDATVRWRPLRRSIYRSFVGRSELVWSRRDQPDGRQNAMGYYVSGDYQLARRWFAGLRYDRSDRADNASLFDLGQSVMVTYWPSEFSQVRGQYRRTDYADGPTANEFLFQFQFSIGAHGAHPF
jgi:TolA-binding protein